MAVPRDITDFVNLTFFYVMLPIANDIHKQDCIIFWYNCITRVTFDSITLTNSPFDKSLYTYRLVLVPGSVPITWGLAWQNQGQVQVHSFIVQILICKSIDSIPACI